MRPVPGSDPPEYRNWAPDPEAAAAFRDGLDRDADRAAVIGGLDAGTFIGLYRGLVRNRLHDHQLRRWVRSGRLSKAWLGTGEEAVTVGACHALGPRDAVGPMIRNAGACHERGMSLTAMFRGILGDERGPSRGRDVHFGDRERGIVAPISMVGSLVPVLGGMALAFRLRGEDRAGLTFVGDGSTATAGFHEGLTAAVALGSPLIVVIQNNQVALGTPVREEMARAFPSFGAAYGVRSLTVDGNHVLDVLAGVRIARRWCIEDGRPVLVAAETFRMGGHATHDEGIARQLLPDELFVHYGKRDPVRQYRHWLRETGRADDAALARVEREVEDEVRMAEGETLGQEAGGGAPPASASGPIGDPLAGTPTRRQEGGPVPPPGS